jgi:transposase
MWLPAYAPDLNAAEGVWANMKNGLGNLAARNVDHLAAIVKNRLKALPPPPTTRRAGINRENPDNSIPVIARLPGGFAE